MPSSSPVPRWSLFVLSVLSAVIFAWAAAMLPWRSWTWFAMLTGVVAMAHAVVAVLALWGHPWRVRAWRIQAATSLGYLAYLTWNLVTSTSYIVALYGNLGRGVAAALGLVWLIVIALTVPLSVWGIAVSGGLGRPKMRGAAALALFALFGAGALQSRQAAAAQPLLSVQERDTLGENLQRRMGTPRTPRPEEAPSLMLAEAVECPQPPQPGVVTVISTYLATNDLGRPQPRSHCAQAETLNDALDQTETAIQAGIAEGPVALDVVTGVQTLGHVVPVVDALQLRPGLDGACVGSRCLMPWQLLALDMFRTLTPIPVIPDLTFGVDAPLLRRALGVPYIEGHRLLGIEGISRVETRSFVWSEQGLTPLRRLRTAGPELSPERVIAARNAAEHYIASTQGEDGRFEYKLNPFTGQTAYRGFSLPRQAGTTLVVCELAEDRERAREIAHASLAMMATTERRVGELSTLRYPANYPTPSTRLGDTALATIAFLSCRDLVGDAFDPLIDRMTRWLLAMQKPNGSFYPTFDLERGAPDPGPDPLFAVGQAVFALVLLEEVAAEHEGFEDVAVVRQAVERAMDYVAEQYWLGTFTSDFFFFEENWHCLAARAALGHHSHRGYEDFCIDYVRFKTRLILDEDSGVDPDFIGGYGFGNVLIPHNTGSAGFGEASSAAMDLLHARGETDARIEHRLKLVLAFLLHHQWAEPTCFACSAEHPVEGAFSEHMGAMEIRIDYVQHAMAALGHGARALGWAGER